MQKERGEGSEKKRNYTILSPEEIAAGKKSEWRELEVVGNVRNLSFKLWTFSHLKALFLNNNNITRLPSDIANLKSLTKLDLSRNKLRTVPAEIGDMLELRELLLCHNNIRILPNELGRLFQVKVLGLQGNPLPNEVLSLANETSNGSVKLLTCLLENLTVCPRPPDRPWCPLVEDKNRSKSQEGFSVMSFNVLSDKYATRQLYGYCPSWALNWEFRKSSILKEILQYNADILTLQEVETEQFYSFFNPELQKNGYNGIFSPKSRAKTMCEEDRRFVDGCAIFWHTSKFHLVKENLVEFNQLAAALSEGADDMLNRVMLRDNIGVMALLETVEPPFSHSMKQRLLIANAHIHWDPEYKDVKLIQTVMLMRELRTFLEEMSPQYNSNAKNGFSPVSQLPIVLCADLNSLPESGVLEFLTNGKISVDHPDFQKLQYDGFLSRCASNENGRKTGELTHHFKLKRAYESEEMPFTNFTYDFTGVLDYIFYASDHLTLLGELGPLDEKYVKDYKLIGFPHPHFPSDHLSLLVEFEFSRPKVRNGPAVAPSGPR